MNSFQTHDDSAIILSLFCFVVTDRRGETRNETKRNPGFASSTMKGFLSNFIALDIFLMKRSIKAGKKPQRRLDGEEEKESFLVYELSMCDRILMNASFQKLHDDIKTLLKHQNIIFHATAILNEEKKDALSFLDFIHNTVKCLKHFLHITCIARETINNRL